MSSILDILQSIIIAGIIIMMVLGFHFMTLKSSIENRVVQQMQGTADVTISILQDEIRWLKSFSHDSLTVTSDSLIFNRTDLNRVTIKAYQDSLVVSKFNGNTMVHYAQYRLGLRDRSLTEPMFSFFEIDSTGEIINGRTMINTDDIHLIRLNVSISHNPNLLVQDSDHNIDRWVDVRKDIFLHSVWLPKAIN